MATTRTMSGILESYRILIFNSKDATVEPLLTDFGITPAYLQQGETLYTETMALVNEQNKEKQEQAAAYDVFYIAQEEAADNTNATSKLVKLLGRNDKDVLNRLKVPATRSGAIAAWLDDTLSFYNRLLNEADFLTKLAPFGKDAAALTQEKDAIENLKTLRNKAIAEKGQAQEATRARNEKLDELKDYSTELRGLAQLALTDKPQLLEKLGILVR